MITINGIEMDDGVDEPDWIDQCEGRLVGEPFMGWPERCARKQAEEFARIMDAGRRMAKDQANV